jgi:hypothetical protein
MEPMGGLGDPVAAHQGRAAFLAEKARTAYSAALATVPLQRKLANAMLAYRYASQAQQEFIGAGDAESAKLAAAGAEEAGRIIQAVMATAKGG